MRKILLLSISLTALWGCKRTDVGPEPPPCLPATAEFRVYGSLYWPPASKENRYYSDTVYKFDWVNFEGPEGQTTYEWTVGNDTRKFTNRNFMLDFRNTPGVYVVKLKTSKQPTTDPCTGLAIDTVTFAEYQRIITITTDTNYRNEFLGCYTGYFGTDSLNTFDLCLKDTFLEESYWCGYTRYVFSEKLKFRNEVGVYASRNIWLDNDTHGCSYIGDSNRYVFKVIFNPFTNILAGTVLIANVYLSDDPKSRKTVNFKARKKYEKGICTFI